jgi:hypothetical protein
MPTDTTTLPSQDDVSPRPAPPECMRQGTFNAADAARARLAPKKKLFSLRENWRRNDRQSSAYESPTSPDSAEPFQPSDLNQLPVGTPDAGDQLVRLSSPQNAGSKDDDKDIYRWAILYENQRG